MHYSEEQVRWNHEAARHQSRSERMSNVRLGLFLVLVTLIGIAIWQSSWLVFGGALVALVAFVAAIIHHNTIEHDREYAQALEAINAEGLARLERRWNDLPERQAESEHLNDAVVVDLDILGHASLGHLLNTTYTSVGRTHLHDWLLHPAEKPVIEQRQTAVKDLTERVEFRDALAVNARLLGAEQSNYQAFLSWAESAPVWLGRTPLIVVSWVLPLLTLVLVGLSLFDLVGRETWIGMLFINGMFSTAFGGPGMSAQGTVSARQNSFRAYGALFRRILDEPFQAELLQAQQSRLSSGPGRADLQMRRLARIVSFSDIRLSLLYPIIQVFTLWSFHLTWFLERWKRDCGQFARPWLEALGDVEALAALATLHHDHPHWHLPTIDPSADHYTAEALAHPLLPPAQAVANNVNLGPSGSFMLITGSNMSGKSTLMRAIGLNAVLAQAGGPVAAKTLTLPPVQLATSIRIQDSLERGVSYYMAELERLKHVVDIAEAADSRLVLYLLDEILHGTNTAERQTAARGIIRHLLNHHAIGVVTTHDLTLAASSDLTKAADTFYFTEDFTRGPHGPTMTFDYTLRPGLAVSTNALKLMELVGLPIEAPATAEAS